MDSVIIPIHKDEKVLRKTLYPLKNFQGEIIFVLDKPTKKSKEMVEKFANKHHNSTLIYKGNLPFEVENIAWKSFIYGALHAKGDRIYFLGADMVCDKRMFSKDLKLPCQFEYIDADNHLYYAYFKFLSKFSKHYFIGCFPKGFAFHKYPWISEEKLYPLEFIERCAKALNFEKYNFPMMHLRKTKNNLRHYIQGITRYRLKFKFYRVLLHAILFFNPYVLLGYLHEKFSRNK